MRVLLVAAVVAVAGVVYLFVARSPGQGRRGKQGQEEAGVVDSPGESPDSLPDPQADPDTFIEAASTEASLDEILAFLESGKDKQLLPRWTFGKQGLAGFPTLRSIYVTALARIGSKAAGDALAMLLTKSASLEEACLAALLLAGRRDTGWEAAALKRAAEDAEPRLRPIRSGMLAAAIACAPAAAAEFLVREAPRGQSKKRPVVISKALFLLPWQQAEPASRALVADPTVTVTAKILYVTAFLERDEIEAIATLTNMAERRELDERMRTETAYAVASAKAFDTGRLAIQTAVAKGDQAAAARHRERLELRRTEAKRFIQAALGFDLDTSDNPKAPPLRRLLER